MYRFFNIAMLFSLFMIGCTSKNESGPAQTNEVIVDESVLNSNTPILEEMAIEDSLIMDDGSKYFDPNTGLLRPDLGEVELENFEKDISLEPITEPSLPDE